MNTLKFTLEKDKKKVTARFSTFSLDISRFYDKLRDIESGTELIFGIRPSDITIQPEGKDRQRIEATVYTMEPMGADTVMNLKVGDDIIKTKIPATLKFDIDQRLYISFNEEAIHLFDTKTERAIL
ncbi:MAG: TOBE domain-containing protein [Candidatus Bathyarchaeia archaeon]